MHAIGTCHYNYFHLHYSVDSNGITEKGVCMLADALKVNQSLKNLRSATAYSIVLMVYAVHATVVSGMFRSPYSFDSKGTQFNFSYYITTSAHNEQQNTLQINLVHLLYLLNLWYYLFVS